jgi:hypothetical protein
MNKTISATCVLLFSISSARGQVEVASTKLPTIETESVRLSSTLLEPDSFPGGLDLPNGPVAKKPNDGDQPCADGLGKPCAVPTEYIYTPGPILRHQLTRTRIAGTLGFASLLHLPRRKWPRRSRH